MARLRHIAAWTVLATFVVGALVAPSLHRAQHSLEQIAMETEAPCHRPAVHHASGASWAGEGTGVEVPECELCATRLIVVLPELAPHSTPRLAGTSYVVPRSHVAHSQVVRDRTIRGPPHLVGSRPA